MFDHRRNRIAGWLLILVVVVGVLTPLGQLGSAIALQHAAPRLELFFGEAWPIYRALALSIIGLRTVVCFYVAWHLVNERSPATPRLAIIGIWVSYVFLGAIGLVVASVFSPKPVDFVSTASRLFWQIVIAAVTTAYLLRSRRVADTYSQARRVPVSTLPE